MTNYTHDYRIFVYTPNSFLKEQTFVFVELFWLKLYFWFHELLYRTKIDIQRTVQPLNDYTKKQTNKMGLGKPFRLPVYV